MRTYNRQPKSPTNSRTSRIGAVSRHTRRLRLHPAAHRVSQSARAYTVTSVSHDRYCVGFAETCRPQRTSVPLPT